MEMREIIRLIEQAQVEPHQFWALSDEMIDEDIIAYHGTPHNFDKFDISKIGSGEGAQAFGHGLYFAQNEEVAKTYRDGLVDPETVPLQFMGRPVDTVWNEEIAERWPEIAKKLSPSRFNEFVNIMSNLSQIANLAEVPSVTRGLSASERIIFDKVIKPHLKKPDCGAGTIYKVRIDANPDDFLDWNMPLTKQSDEIREFFKDVFQAPDIPGQLAYYRKAGRTLQSPETSMDMLKAGIPGIKYLDGDSRQAGEGTYNYVIFDDSLIHIIERY